MLDSILHNLTRLRLTEFLDRRAENLVPALHRLHRSRRDGRRPPPRLPIPLVNLYDLTYSQLKRVDGSLLVSDAWLESAWESACGVSESPPESFLAVAESVSRPYCVEPLLPLTELQRTAFQAEREIIGRHPVWQEVLQQALQAARFDFPVLLTGETGVGKEVIAGRSMRTAAALRVTPFS